MGPRPGGPFTLPYLQVFIERRRVELMHETAVVLLNDLLMRKNQISQVLDVE